MVGGEGEGLCNEIGKTWLLQEIRHREITGSAEPGRLWVAETSLYTHSWLED